MNNYLTKLETEIAEVDHRIAGLQACISANMRLPRTKRLIKAQQAEIAALKKHQEQIVRRIQHTTVGAAKPGQVM